MDKKIDRLTGRNDSRIAGEYPNYGQYCATGAIIYHCTDGRWYSGNDVAIGYDRFIALTPLTSNQLSALQAKGIKI